MTRRKTINNKINHQKLIKIIISSIVTIFIGVVVYGIYKSNLTNNIGVEKSKVTSHKDATYQIEGKPITLVNGLSEVEAAPGSASKTITRYFGNDALGDLNGDGKKDVAFLLTQNSGGSGTFYYVVVALDSEKGYQGTNAVLLGDRIAPQTTEIQDGKVIVNYADRRPDESFAVQPSVGISKYLKIIDNKLVEVNIVSQITNREWKWASTQMNNDTVVFPKKKNAFTLTFKEDGSISGKTDCNSFFGQYKVADNKLSFDRFGSTLMFCEGSQESVFMKALNEIESYFIDKNNNLILQIKFDSGSMIFK